MVKSSLRALFSRPADLNTSQIFVAMSGTSLDQLDEGYDLLGKALYQADQVTGDSFTSQLALARRLVRAGKLDQAHIAQESLESLVLSLAKGNLLNERLMMFAPRSAVVTAMDRRLRGSHWRLKEDVGIQRRPVVFERDEGALEKLLEGVVGSRQFSYRGIIESLVFSGIEIPFDWDVPKNVQVQAMPAVGMATHIGSRPSQQDMGFVFEAVLPDSRKVRIAIVADGHYNEGDAASYLSILFFTVRFLNGLIAYPGFETSELIHQTLLNIDEELQSEIADGGTTFTAFVEVASEKYIVNIGDSRTLFMSPDKEYTQVTISHSVWDPPTGKRHGQYAFLRDIGNRDGKKFASLTHLSAEPDIFVPTTPITGGLIYLMSDGIDPTIGADLHSLYPTASPQFVADRMIESMLNSYLQYDNMTAIVLPAVTP